MVGTMGKSCENSRRFPVSALIILLLLILAGVNAGQAQSFDASNTGGPTPLDAPWRLQFGDDPAYAQPGFDDSHWTLHRIDKDWASAGHKGYAGYAWYRMRVILPKGNEPLAIAIYPPAEAAVEVYIDGALAGTIGRMRPEPVWTMRRDVYAIAVPAALHGRPVELALRVWESPLQAVNPGAGAASHPPLAGTAADVERIVSLEQQNRWVAQIPDWVVDMLGVAVGLFSLGLFLLQRHAREYAYAAGFLLGLGVEPLYMWISIQTGADARIFWQVDMGMRSLSTYFWVLFTWSFVRARADRLLYACLAASWILSIGAALVNLGIIHNAGYYWMIAAADLFLSSAVFVRLYTLARRGNRDAKLFLVPFTLWIAMWCVMVSIEALYYSGIVDLTGAMILYHDARFTITWIHVGWVVLILAVGTVLVLRFARSAEQEQRLRTEMESARTVQQILVPEEVPSIPGFSIQAVYHPAGEVGGDFYQVLPIPNGGLLAVIGDVSGKGMPAAMTVSLLVGTIRTLAQYTHDPAEVLTAMNQRMMGRSSGGFTTALVLRLDPDGTLTAANAGHLVPYANGKELDIDNSLPLGITTCAAYSNSTLHLEADTTLTLLTDGVVEAQNAKGELFGFDRAAEISSRPAQKVAEAAQAFGQQDDITVVTLACTGVPDPASAPVSA
ncbi:MAG: SpoIIE family protein phosphatase [Silvibacterium sp.]|nr:SpoIIE family protein phosphatase [Silvibacterium sp.]